MKLEEVINKIEELEYIKTILQTEIDLNVMSVNEIIYILYIKLEDVKEVSKIINNFGFRVKSNRGFRKYIHQDISNILKDVNAINDIKLNQIVTKLFRSKRRNFYT